MGKWKKMVLVPGHVSSENMLCLTRRESCLWSWKILLSSRPCYGSEDICDDLAGGEKVKPLNLEEVRRSLAGGEPEGSSTDPGY